MVPKSASKGAKAIEEARGARAKGHQAGHQHHRGDCQSHAERHDGDARWIAHARKRITPIVAGLERALAGRAWTLVDGPASSHGTSSSASTARARCYGLVTRPATARGSTTNLE